MIGKVKYQFNSLKNNHGAAGIALAVLLFILIIALCIGFVALIAGAVWAISATIIYYGASLFGHAISFKAAYGAAMLLSVIGGALGGVRVVKNKS